jgi:hypothetical protein
LGYGEKLQKVMSYIGIFTIPLVVGKFQALDHIRQDVRGDNVKAVEW